MRKKQLSHEMIEGIHRVYQNVSYLRKRAGLTVEQMAEIMGIEPKKLLAAEKLEGVDYFYNFHIKQIMVILIFHQTPSSRKNCGRQAAIKREIKRGFREKTPINEKEIPLGISF